MFVSDNDVIQLELVGALQGQIIRNVFHYLIDHGQGGAVNLQTVIPLWFVEFDNMVLASLHTSVSYNLVIGKNLTVPEQIYEANVSATGDALGQCLPVHDTMSVKLIRTLGTTRNGRKSYSGIDEANTDAGDLLLNQSFVDDIEEFHGTTRTYEFPGSSPAFNVNLIPVIVGRTAVTPGNYQLDLSKINLIAGAQVNSRVRTQNTRKF